MSVQISPRAKLVTGAILAALALPAQAHAARTAVYGGSTSAGEPIVVRADSKAKKLRGIVLSYIAPCSDDQMFPYAGELRAGTVQRLSAGRGIRHSETNPDPDVPVHFVQMWVLPDEPGLEPGYEQRDVDADLGRGGWVSLASGSQAYADDPAVRLCNSRAVLHAARLHRGESLRLPDPHGARPGETSVLHLFVARGGVEMEVLGELDTGDAARLFGAGGQLLTAPNEAEVLLWEMHPGPR